jgi:hypothetical protein
MTIGTERIIESGGEEIRVLYTNRALAEAEEYLDKGIIEILQGYESGTSGLRDTAALLRAGMEAARRKARTGKRPISMNDAYDVLDNVGFGEVAAEILEAVTEVLNPQDNSGN